VASLTVEERERLMRRQSAHSIKLRMRSRRATATFPRMLSGSTNRSAEDGMPLNRRCRLLWRKITVS